MNGKFALDFINIFSSSSGKEQLYSLIKKERIMFIRLSKSKKTRFFNFIFNLILKSPTGKLYLVRIMSRLR